MGRSSFENNTPLCQMNIEEKYARPLEFLDLLGVGFRVQREC